MANTEYQAYLTKIKDMFLGDTNYSHAMKAISSGKNTFTINQKFNKKIFDMEWIDVIEDCIPELDNIVRNPRKFITIEEDIIDISLAKSISVESVRHLAQHTNMIANVDEEQGTVTPSRILNTSKEESYEVYENRFIYTLLNKLSDFISKRFDLIQKTVLKESSELEINIHSEYQYQGSDMKVDLKASSNLPFDDMREGISSDDLTPIERITKMHRIINSFLNSPFAKEMKNSAPVRPPITRTNVIKKEPNFKKALILWQFIESYSKTGFEVRQVQETTALPEALDDQYRHILFLNDLILENLSSMRMDGQNINEINDALKKQTEVVTADSSGLYDEGMYQDEEFPALNLDLREVRKVYFKTKGDKTYNSEEYREITSALDRVINQYNILQAKKDEALKEKLIKAQKLEEERVRRKNKADQQRALEKRKREEEESIALRRREEKRRIKAEKEASRRKILELQELERKNLEEMALQKEEDMKVDAYRELLEKRMNKELKNFEDEQDNIVEMEMINDQIDYKDSLEEFKKQRLEAYSKYLDEEISKLENNKE